MGPMSSGQMLWHLLIGFVLEERESFVEADFIWTIECFLRMALKKLSLLAGGSE
ncbi:hypothetical protein DY000_02035102 [Brassica cretica]|uniref:Uncharacterized protein n=1 Tax=Brassica cretica TaxID=69181 RepID=A0ABQ7DGN9_BRACR|nr:hypothetical protein DY000_02035102 [Brassica cretica]